MAYRVLVQRVVWVVKAQSDQEIPKMEPGDVVRVEEGMWLESQQETLLEQVVDELDIGAIVRAVNGIQ